MVTLLNIKKYVHTLLWNMLYGYITKYKYIYIYVHAFIWNMLYGLKKMFQTTNQCMYIIYTYYIFQGLFEHVFLQGLA